MWKVCWNKGRLYWKMAKLFYFCHLKKLVRPETFGPYHVCYLWRTSQPSQLRLRWTSGTCYELGPVTALFVRLCWSNSYSYYLRAAALQIFLCPRNIGKRRWIHDIITSHVLSWSMTSLHPMYYLSCLRSLMYSCYIANYFTNSMILQTFFPSKRYEVWN